MPLKIEFSTVVLAIAVASVIDFDEDGGPTTLLIFHVLFLEPFLEALQVLSNMT